VDPPSHTRGSRWFVSHTLVAKAALVAKAGLAPGPVHLLFARTLCGQYGGLAVRLGKFEEELQFGRGIPWRQRTSSPTHATRIVRGPSSPRTHPCRRRLSLPHAPTMVATVELAAHMARRRSCSRRTRDMAAGRACPRQPA
jgi:hypothetical protein